MLMETGHNKNVANFEAVIIILTSLGPLYNPAQALILLPALQTKLTEAKAALAAVNAAEADRTVKTDEIQAEFRDLDKYAVNIKRVAAITVNDEAFNRDLQNLVNRMRPQKRSTGVPDDPSTPDVDESRTNRSTSMRSYDSQIGLLAEISALLKTKAGIYDSPDPEYTIEAVDAKVESLSTKNNAAKTSVALLGSALDARDQCLYDEQTGVLKRIKLIKTQLLFKPGKDSAAYRQVNALEFRPVPR